MTLPRPDLSAPVIEPDEPDTEPEPAEPEYEPAPDPQPAPLPGPLPPSTPAASRAHDCARLPRVVLPEAAPDLDTWTALLWPWLTQTALQPRPVAALARVLASRVDGRDLTVDTAHPAGRTAYTLARTLGALVEGGLLEPAGPGRHRIVLPRRD